MTETLIPKSAFLDIGSIGTQEQFTTSEEIIPAGRVVHVTAGAGNTGAVYIGDEDVSSSTGHILNPGQAIELEYDQPWDISNLWADADTNANKVSIFWMGEA